MSTSSSSTDSDTSSSSSSSSSNSSSPSSLPKTSISGSSEKNTSSTSSGSFISVRSLKSPGTSGTIEVIIRQTDAASLLEEEDHDPAAISSAHDDASNSHFDQGTETEISASSPPSGNSDLMDNLEINEPVGHFISDSNLTTIVESEEKDSSYRLQPLPGSYLDHTITSHQLVEAEKDAKGCVAEDFNVADLEKKNYISDQLQSIGDSNFSSTFGHEEKKEEGQAPLSNNEAAILENSEEEEGSSSSTTTSDELDICSSKFNPLKALYSPYFPLDPEAPVYDNVEQFVSVYERRGREHHAATAKKASDLKAKTVSEGASVLRDRNFLPEQMPIKGSRKEYPDVVKYMHKQERGPMSVLSKCVRESLRVRIYIRGIDRIRGHCTGYLVAFDKHWNLALVDVDECYNRKRFRKTPVMLDDDAKKKTSGCLRRQLKKRADDKTEEVGASTLRIVKCRRKTELCERHVAQMVVRGEHVAFVSIL